MTGTEVAAIITATGVILTLVGRAVKGGLDERRAAEQRRYDRSQVAATAAAADVAARREAWAAFWASWDAISRWIARRETPQDPAPVMVRPPVHEDA